MSEPRATAPLHICFVDYALDPTKPGRSGLSDMVWDMATTLINKGHKVDIVASYYTDHYPDDRVAVHNFPTPPIGYRNIVGQLWILARAAAIVKQLDPDIVHTPEYVSTAVLASLGVRTPLVVTPPGNIYQWLATGTSIFEWHYVQVLKWAARVAARRSACVIASSRTMQYWWERTGTPPGRMAVIPLGIDPTRFAVRATPRTALGVAEDALMFLYVGRLSREKGIHDLLTALQEIREQADLARVRIELIGDGPERAELERFVQAAHLDGIVCFHGWVEPDNLPGWYSAADALILPSHHEAFGRVLAESMICGTPVIGSAVGGAADHIHEGVNGFLFPAGNASALAAILVRVIRDPTDVRDLRPGTSNYAQQHLGWQHVIERTIAEVYLPVLEAECQRSVENGPTIAAK